MSFDLLDTAFGWVAAIVLFASLGWVLFGPEDDQ